MHLVVPLPQSEVCVRSKKSKLSFVFQQKNITKSRYNDDIAFSSLIPVFTFIDGGYLVPGCDAVQPRLWQGSLPRWQHPRTLQQDSNPGLSGGSVLRTDGQLHMCAIGSVVYLWGVPVFFFGTVVIGLFITFTGFESQQLVSVFQIGFCI
jgi:hypothetical protein